MGSKKKWLRRKMFESFEEEAQVQQQVESAPEPAEPVVKERSIPFKRPLKSRKK